MKSFFADIFKYCEQLIRFFKLGFGRINRGTRALFSRLFKNNKNAARYPRSAGGVSAYMTSKKPIKWLKKKPIVFAACSLIIIVVVVFAMTLPVPHNEAFLSVNKSIAVADKNPSAVVSGSETINTTETEIVLLEQSGELTSLNAVDTQNISTVNDNESASAIPEATPIPTTAPDEVELVPGVRDPRILEIQERLMALDYMDHDEPTDLYGKGTKYALQLFQRKNSLQVDGLLGEKTITALFTQEALPYTVKLGDRGSDVVAMQERLQELNYLKAGHTGYFGTDTEAAVKSFQKRNGLSADGNVGEYTREILYSENAKPAKTTSSSGGSSGGSGGGSVIAVGNPDEASVDKLIEIAKSKLGCEYTRAGKGPDEFDCSGFVYYCLNTAGYRIKYMTSKGWANCSLPKVTSMSEMVKGDIICFKGHVGIYMGGGQMIDAGSGDDQVRICSNIMNSSYWTRNFICARRVF